MLVRQLLSSTNSRLIARSGSVCSQYGLTHSWKQKQLQDRYLCIGDIAGKEGFLQMVPGFPQYRRGMATSAHLWNKTDMNPPHIEKEVCEVLDADVSALDVGEEYLLPVEGHKVFLIQPDIRGQFKAQSRDSEIQHRLEESASLIESLPKWTIGATSIEKIRSHERVFSKGKFQKLTERIQTASHCTAVFISTSMLTGAQLSFLQKEWQKPVYDRFTMVLQIFRVRAKTKEARLQVALAAIPYYRSRLTGMHLGTLDQQKGGTSYIGGAGETQFELRQRILKDKELKIRRALSRVKEHRDSLRSKRMKRECPTVAVVGYTNAGKTSLIKMLTQDDHMTPRDQVFATVDVTAHAGLLASRMKVLYIDTVGFISEIPTCLIASFSATLEDAVLADVIVHVRDISHPNAEMQKVTVMQTLESLSGGVDVQNRVIEVCNKVDKLDRERAAGLIPEGAVGVSSTLGFGLEDLVSRIEEIAVQTTGRLRKCFRVPMGGPHLAWLYKEATVENTRSCDTDSEHLLVDTLLTQSAYAKFLSQFAPKRKKT